MSRLLHNSTIFLNHFSTQSKLYLTRESFSSKIVNIYNIVKPHTDLGAPECTIYKVNLVKREMRQLKGKIKVRFKKKSKIKMPLDGKGNKRYKVLFFNKSNITIITR